MAQTIAPYEVIVVDNNSSDGTMAIAREYPGVRVLREKRQGVVFARNRGFDAARGDIIGRIDADTIIELNWIETVQRIFSEDIGLAAASGRVHYYDMALSRVADPLDGYFRRALARDLRVMGTAFLQGANMALRRNSWQAVRGAACTQGEMHEDFDLAIHLCDLGLAVRYDGRLQAGISARRTDVGFLAFMDYARISPHTYAIHDRRHASRIYWVCLWALLGYVPGRLLYRGFDPELERFSFKRLLFLRQPSRPNPADM
jgi:glycosyltransferase involved in cell wall biosynthesis